jgi:hypothetical protein
MNRVAPTRGDDPGQRGVVLFSKPDSGNDSWHA